jgi:hypothetical protein
MIAIPLNSVPSQQVSVTLNGQACTIAVYQKSTGMFFDLTSNGVVLLTAVICNDRNYLVRYEYLGFSGDLSFVDTQGVTDPQYSGFGTQAQNPRYVLLYLTPDEVASTQ